MSDMKFELKGVGGQLTVYHDKVVIERKGAIGFLSKGFSGAKTIPMSSIQSVQFKRGTGFTNGYIQFGILGGRECRGGLFAAADDENTVMLSYKYNEVAQEIKDYIENQILDRAKPHETVVQQTSPADELKKFKELLDMGVISQAEFDAKKKQILGL